MRLPFEKHLAPLAFLVLIHLAVFAQLIFLDRSGAPYEILHWDFASQGQPWLVYTSDALRAGHWPLWCPYVGGGSPFFLNPQNPLYSPITWLVSGTIGYTQYVAQLQSLLFILLGGLGAYALSFALWRSRAGALVSALCFDLTPAVYGNLEHSAYIAAYWLMPWLFLAVLATVRRGSRREVAALTTVIYMLIVTGYPAVVVMILGWAAVWAVFLIRREESPGARTAAWGRGLVAAGLAVGLSAIYWYPLVVYSHQFTRGAGLDLYRALQGGNLRFADLSNLLFSILLTHPLKGPEADVSMRGIYMGALALPLIGLAIHRRRDAWTLAIGTFSTLTFLMATGLEFFGRTALHVVLPALNFSRFPAGDSRTLMVLGLAMLAGRGMSVVSRREPGLRRAYMLGYGLLVFILVEGMGGLALLFPHEEFMGTILNDVCAVVLFGVLALALAAWLGRRWVPGALCVLLACDLGVGFSHNRTVAGERPVDYAGNRAAHRTQFRSEDALLPRQTGSLGDMSNFELCEPANGGLITKHFFLGEYNPLRMIRYEHLIAGPMRAWLLDGPRLAICQGALPIEGPGMASSLATTSFRITEYTPNRIVYHLDLKQAAWVVFNETYFPGWIARGPRGDLPLQEVLGGLRGLRLGAGSQELVTEFHPAALRPAMIISLASLLMALGLLFRRRKTFAGIEGSSAQRDGAPSLPLS